MKRAKEYSWEQIALINTLHGYIGEAGFYPAKLLAKRVAKKYPIASSILNFTPAKVGYTLKSMRMNIKKRRGVKGATYYFLTPEVINWHYSGRVDDDTLKRFHLPHNLLREQYNVFRRVNSSATLNKAGVAL